MVFPRAFVRAISAGVVALGVALSVGNAFSHEFKLGSLVIGHPWARATPPGAKVAGGYLTVDNAAGEDDRLVAATIEIAGRAEMHQMSMDNGVMKMRPVDNGIEVPAGGKVSLDPSGYHLMFMDLKQPLKEGDSIPGTLTFEKAGTVAVTFKVEAIGARAPMGEGHDMNGMPGQ